MSQRQEPSAGGLPPHLDPRGAGSGRAAADATDLPPHLDPRGSRRPGSRGVPGTAAPSRGRRVGRVLSWVALALSVVVFAVATVGYVLFHKYDGQIHRIAGLNTVLPGAKKPAAAPRDARNVLMVGSDTRDTTGDQFQGTGADYTTGQRSDTIILAHLFAGTDQAQLVSFPRDSWVSIPAYTDAKTGKTNPEHKAKINSAITEGGPKLLIATIERLTDIRVDNYVQIDFAGFQAMVAKLGGVQVCLLHPAKDSYSGIDLPAGTQVINGKQALAFVRQRHGLPDGDLDRIKRQQAFIASIARKALSSGTLLNPVKLNGFLDAATSSVQVDDSLSGAGLTNLALRLRNFSAGNVVFTTVPYTNINATRDRQSVVLLDDTKAAAMFDALRRDQSPQDAAAATARAGGPAPSSDPHTVPPAAVKVAVYNAGGSSGLGGRAAADLKTAGFRVTTVGNRVTGASGTVVTYGPDAEQAARTLAAAVRGATLRSDPSLGSTLQLLVGSSYSGATQVRTGTATTAPAPSPAPSTPTSPTVTAANDTCVE